MTMAVDWDIKPQTKLKSHLLVNICQSQQKSSVLLSAEMF